MESQLKANIDGRKGEPSSFEDAWNVIEPRFEVLKTFFGGLKTLFPNTLSVECDFSCIGLEMTEYQKCLTDFSHEGVLRSK